MGSSGGVGADTTAAQMEAQRRLNKSMADSAAAEAEAKANASLAMAKAKAAEQQAMEATQKETIQAMEQAAAKEVEVTEVAGAPDVQGMVMDRPSVKGMGFMQIPEGNMDEEEEGPRSSTPSRGM